MPRPPGITDAQWRDWVWQMQERVRSAKDLERYVNPTEDERRAIEALAERFRFVITPYYASLMDPECRAALRHPRHGIRVTRRAPHLRHARMVGWTGRPPKTPCPRHR